MISASTRHAKETASRYAPRLVEKHGSIITRPWYDVMISNMSAGRVFGNIILSTVVCGTCFAELDTVLVFKIFYGVFGGGTRLAMSKTGCTPDSSSLKPGSGATEGVLD